jgi:hypothetical protein
VHIGKIRNESKIVIYKRGKEERKAKGGKGDERREVRQADRFQAPVAIN